MKNLYSDKQCMYWVSCGVAEMRLARKFVFYNRLKSRSLFAYDQDPC